MNQDRFSDLRDFMDHAISQLGTSGIDCIIHQNYQEIFRHTAGYMDLETKAPIIPGAYYNIYSATKVITCVAAMQLVEKGLLCLSDPVSKYLPEYADLKVKSGTYCIYPAHKQILVVDLFKMTAGLNYDQDTPEKRRFFEETNRRFTTREYARVMAQEPLCFEPGEGWCYSYCHDVLAAVLEVAAGTTFGEYLREHIFLPLGMNETDFTLPEEKRSRLAPQYQYDPVTGATGRISDECLGRAGDRHESGGGGLIMTAEDYMLFADALSNGGVGANGARIISAASINLMRQNHLSGKALDDFHLMVPSAGVGYGLGVGTTFDPTASLSLVPKGAFYWGGMGGVQNLFDPDNHLSLFVAQHTVGAPVSLIRPQMLNIIYSHL